MTDARSSSKQRPIGFKNDAKLNSRSPNRNATSTNDKKIMKKTIDENLEEIQDVASRDILSENYLTFQDKVGDIIEIHDDLLALHLNVIREDAQLLTKESEIIADAQHQSLEHDIEKYVDGLEEIVKKKLHLYKELATKIKKFKQALKDEEEYSKKLKETVYF